MPTARLDLAYLGGGFSGWAAQPGQRTVQGELEAGLERILGERIRLSVAGRTDAGVHAWGQVASFELAGPPPGGLARSLNGITADDLAVLAAAQAPDGFDARRDARSRTYCYRVLAARLPNPFERGLSLWWPHPLEREALGRCADAVVGRHDFTAFTPTDTEHVRFERDVFRCWWRDSLSTLPPGQAEGGRDSVTPWPGELLELWIEADAFMRNMVRVLVGTMLEVACGRRTIEDFERLLAGAPREHAGDTARAHGLHFASVRY